MSPLLVIHYRMEDKNRTTREVLLTLKDVNILA